MLPEKKLIGKRLRMTMADDRTFELWSSFMPRRKEIKNILSANLYALQVYDPSTTYENFTLQTPFEKWATVEVEEIESVPSDMEIFILPAGLYAVFLHKGASATAEKTFRYIFETWLPASGYVANTRPHFEILGENYKNNDPDSEEEIWVPVKLR